MVWPFGQHTYSDISDVSVNPSKAEVDIPMESRAQYRYTGWFLIL